MNSFYVVKRNDGFYICIDEDTGLAYYGLFRSVYFFGNYESAKRYTDSESRVVRVTVTEHEEENNKT